MQFHHAFFELCKIAPNVCKLSAQKVHVVHNDPIVELHRAGELLEILRDPVVVLGLMHEGVLKVCMPGFALHCDKFGHTLPVVWRDVLSPEIDPHKCLNELGISNRLLGHRLSGRERSG